MLRGVSKTAHHLAADVLIFATRVSDSALGHVLLSVNSHVQCAQRCVVGGVIVVVIEIASMIATIVVSKHVQDTAQHSCDPAPVQTMLM